MNRHLKIYFPKPLAPQAIFSFLFNFNKKRQKNVTAQIDSP